MTTSYETIKAMANEAIDNIIRQEAENLLDNYGYPFSDYGLREILSTYVENKKELLALFSKHPNWNPKRLYISFSADLHRGCDIGAIKKFVKWILTENMKEANKREYKIDGKEYREWFWVSNFTNNDKAKQNVKIIANKCVRLFDSYYDIGHSLYVLPEDYQKFATFENFFKYLERKVENSPVLTSNESFNDAEYVNNLFSFLKKENGNPLLRVQNGQKWSRVANKICTIYGYNKIVDMQTVSWEVNGELHSRTQDKGYNSQFASFADGINPFTITRHTVLSLNPIDYWTMSFGSNWASCHTIDKENLRRTSHNYNGCYSSGTESYMLDESSFIMYTVTPEFDENKGLENADKERRCVFFYGEDKLIQSRVYPDGRDGGDKSIAGDFRAIAQKVIAECLNSPNLWRLERNVASSYIHTEIGSTHYADYNRYSDNNVSFLKRSENDNEKNIKMIPVGHKPICPNCGDSHTYEENILCPMCCGEGKICDRCGNYVSDDDYIVDEDTGRIYCDSDCASEDGCYWCENVCEYHSENVYFDNYDEEYFYDRYGDYIVTADNSTFRDTENAEAAGYVWVETENDWYYEDKVEYCTHCEEYVLKEDYNYNKDMCNYCAELEEEEG